MGSGVLNPDPLEETKSIAPLFGIKATVLGTLELRADELWADLLGAALGMPESKGSACFFPCPPSFLEAPPVAWVPQLDNSILPTPNSSPLMQPG